MTDAALHVEPETDVALAKRIVALSFNLMRREPPQPSLNETVETTMRRKADYYLEHAIAGCIWWRLTGDERAAIRARVIAREPWYRNHLESVSLEMDCSKEIITILKNARHHDTTPWEQVSRA